ncbi:hypothetical protein GCM10011534_11960 [Pseudooceanicola nanhaiensis]|jgi:hypothetical protein|uniref:Uncharacterized protein n=1 Tax=Pseudooceanicola nanhaiensis TaxID=375761 RepID=A0A917WD12_9RHOB|nr:hypothetical protein [Pseudooceanicola nanhaiensis]GGL91403.1 hypothetical protein GCM10011534_11960 [Pseudooceanicola nanhaiensis]
MAEFAKGTTVTAARSRAEIEDMLGRFGADGFMSGRDGRHVVVAFKARGRQIMFRMTMPDPADHYLTPTGKQRSDADARKAADAEDRRMWRALALSIKAKLVGVEDGIESFEQAFMAHVVMPDGLTLSDHITPRIAEAYDTGSMPPLLPPPAKSS